MLLGGCSNMQCSSFFNFFLSLYGCCKFLSLNFIFIKLYRGFVGQKNICQTFSRTFPFKSTPKECFSENLLIKVRFSKSGTNLFIIINLYLQWLIQDEVTRVFRDERYEFNLKIKKFLGQSYIG